MIRKSVWFSGVSFLQQIRLSALSITYLSQLIKHMNKYNVTIIGGDFNAKFGKTMTFQNHIMNA